MKRAATYKTTLGFFLGLVLLLLTAGGAHGQVPLAESKLTASDGTGGELFGDAMTFENGTLLVGAPFDNDRGDISGSAYVFEPAGGSFVETQKLLASDGQAGDRFGDAVAMSAETAVIGAFLDDDDGQDAGAAYVFQRDGAGDLVEVAKLTASDGAAGDYFGVSVAISGNRIVIGASHEGNGGNGAAYVFEANGAGGYVEVDVLAASDGEAGDAFGSSAAVEGDRIVVGAMLEDTIGENAGAAYEFGPDGTGGFAEVVKLTGSDTAPADQFGSSMTSTGNTFVIGALGDGDAAGSAYVFEPSGGQLGETVKLAASDGASRDFFGISVTVAMMGDSIVLGATGDDDNGGMSGSVYIFEPDGGGGFNESKLTPSDGAPVDLFGGSVAVAGDTLFVGARGDDDAGPDSGSVYVFQPPNAAPTIDAIADQTDTEGDAVAVQAAAADPDGDALTFTAEGLPDGLGIDPVTGLISGTISDGASSGSPYAVTVTVDDGRGGTAGTSFTWTVEVAFNDRRCPGNIGDISIDDNLVVPAGTTCTLRGTSVDGNIEVRSGATLHATDVEVDGNVIGEGQKKLVLLDSSVDGNVEAKEGGIVRVVRTGIDGNIKVEENDRIVRVNKNTVDGNIEVLKNTGGARINKNNVDGNLKCEDNSPAPQGSGNVVDGSKEDQCRRL